MLASLLRFKIIVRYSKCFKTQNISSPLKSNKHPQIVALSRVQERKNTVILFKSITCRRQSPEGSGRRPCRQMLQITRRREELAIFADFSEA
jgi:hypothetical protein